MKLGLGLSLSRGGGTAAFSPLSLSPTAWYDPSDLTTLFQNSNGTGAVTADGDPVGYMADKSGNGHHLTQASGAVLPVVKISGGLTWLEFTADVLSKVTGSFAQPYDRISAIRQNSWTSGGTLFCGESDTGILWQFGTTPDLGLYDGSSACTNSTAALNTNYVITERFDGASSSLQVNLGSAATGNPGTTTQTGINIGGKSSLAQFGQMRFFGMVLRQGTLSAGEKTSLRNYLAAKAGVTL